jgi:hypothetical protein
MFIICDLYQRFGAAYEVVPIADLRPMAVPAKYCALVPEYVMVLHEVTRQQTPTSEKLSQWVAANQVPVHTTRAFAHYQQRLAAETMPARKSNLGELAIQETMNDFALDEPRKTGVFLFEDHKIARASFLVPDNCRKISTRAFLIFLEQKGWLASAAQIERQAIQAGRNFSNLRFPPE